MGELKRTILYAAHQDAGATLVDFGGWEMPIQYPSGIIAEHLYCRSRCAIFDVSHMKTPAECGADVAVGEAQPLGLDTAFGGPYLGFMTATHAMMRHLPGRIVGQTVDTEGRTGYVLTLSAREQHIRREKASSNICSNEQLCTLRAGIYLSAMARFHLEQEHIQAAEREIWSIADLPDADRAEYLVLRGRIALRKEQYENAALYLRQAEELPELPRILRRELYKSLEHCYRELEDYKQAYEYAAKQLSL